MRRLFPGPGEDFGGLRRRPSHDELSVARQSLDQHLRVHAGAVSGQDAYRILLRERGQERHFWEAVLETYPEPLGSWVCYKSRQLFRSGIFLKPGKNFVQEEYLAGPVPVNGTFEPLAR